MSPLPYQAVVFDLDDTLLRDDLSISDFTVNTLRRLAERGIRIIPASGRAQLSMKPFLKRLDCASLYISCNGAEIWDARTDQLLHRETFSRETGQAIAAFGKKHGVYTQTYADAFFYYNEESHWARQYAASSMLRGVCVGDLEAFIQEPRCKILMMDTVEHISSMLQEARELFAGQVSVTCSKPWFLEFNPLKATKGLALERAASLLGLPPEAFLAFGDSLNDLSMLQRAGRGVLMTNGRADLREAADDVCPSNQEDGVARYLAQVFGEVPA